MPDAFADGGRHRHHRAREGYGRPPQSFGPGDIGILNYALHARVPLEAACYTVATAANLPLTARQVLAAVQQTGFRV